MDNNHESRRKSAHSRYAANMRWAALWMALGLGLVAAAFLLVPGDSYIIGWVLVTFGFLMLLLWLSLWSLEW